MKAFVSVIIPVFNAEKYLEECIESIISSTVFNGIEVILVDDGSRDSSGSICDSFSQKYENIRSFHIENGGVSNARNFGISKACGEYIAFCDADDCYVNDILHKSVLKLKEYGTDLIFFDFINEQRNNSVFRLPFSCNLVLTKKTITDVFEYTLKNEGFNSVWNKLFKRDLIEQNEISFTPGQKHGEDRDFVIKFLSVCNTAFYLPEAGYFYRYVKTSAVNKKRTDYFDNIYDEVVFKLDMASKFNISFSEAEKLIKENAVKRIVSSAFTAAENGAKSFSVSLELLYESKELFRILCEHRDVIFDNDAYKKVAEFLCNKKTLYCWCYIRFLKLKEQIYKLIKG